MKRIHACCLAALAAFALAFAGGLAVGAAAKDPLDEPYSMSKRDAIRWWCLLVGAADDVRADYFQGSRPPTAASPPRIVISWYNRTAPDRRLGFTNSAQQAQVERRAVGAKDLLKSIDPGLPVFIKLGEKSADHKLF